jgi:hypothetical protein
VQVSGQKVSRHPRRHLCSATACCALLRRLDELRRNWLDAEGASETELKKRTLTNLYNARPTWLENAHERLDEAVFTAYGWPSDPSDEEVLKICSYSTWNDTILVRDGDNKLLDPC